MPEERDETDGTPEWAKRLFGRLRRMRGYAAAFIVFLGGPLYGAYQIWNAILNDRILAITIASRHSRWITRESDPAWFSLSLALWSLFLFAPFVMLLVAQKRPILMEKLKELLRIQR